jgi:UDPglucose--hexose-1-phosphate uridylyltransferase
VSDVRIDPLSGRQAVIAPGRARRPGAWRGAVEPPSAEELDACPFCAGREDRTPPETLRLGSDPWQVRVVPNLYPAFERQEVVVLAPRHARSLVELSDAELAVVAEAWAERSRAARVEGFPYVHALVNEGREAGSSLPHAHAQLLWLRESPPEVVREAPQLAAGSCALCSLDAPLVAERAGVRLLAAPAPRAPYELLVAPTEHRAGGLEDAALADALALAVDGIRRLHSVEGAVPLNLWLHAGEHWHIEVVPRLGFLAGIELGAGYFVSALAPEDAATALRAALP